MNVLLIIITTLFSLSTIAQPNNYIYDCNGVGTIFFEYKTRTVLSERERCKSENKNFCYFKSNYKPTVGYLSKLNLDEQLVKEYSEFCTNLKAKELATNLRTTFNYINSNNFVGLQYYDCRDNGDYSASYCTALEKFNPTAILSLAVENVFNSLIDIGRPELTTDNYLKDCIKKGDDNPKNMSSCMVTIY